MTDATTPGTMSPGLQGVAERAKRNPSQKLFALARFIDEPSLERAYRRLRKDAAVGLDGVTVEQYGQRLQENMRVLHERMKAGRYRHQPIRRVHIPKDNGKTRPIGVSTVEDKIVQGAIREVLEAVYEQDFKDCSHGFRPGRKAHDAIRAVDKAVWKGARYILEADIESFFDSLDRARLMEMLRERIADESLMRLIGKCLHVGILDGEEYTEPEVGATQGSSLSPLLGNVYLHHVLDGWFEDVMKPTLRGRATLVRYADDFVICFDRPDDARRVEAALYQRMETYGLRLHPAKTRLLTFKPPDDGENKGSATFDFLGFTLHWERTLRGAWRVACKTRSVRLRRAIASVGEWCRRHRHLPIKQQHATLTRKLEGHYNYFGVNGNTRSLSLLRHATERLWQKWLNRRSQRAHMMWERFKAVLQRYPLPTPRVRVQIWGT